MNPHLMLFIACLLSGTALPLPEDAALLAAGSLIESPSGFAAASVAGVLGVLARDALFYGLGRAVGEGLFRFPLVRALLGSRLLVARDAYRARGARAVLFARCAVGFRTPSFLVAGALGVRARDFFAWDLLGACVSVPATLALGWAAGDLVQQAVAWGSERVPLLLALAGVIALAWFTRSRHEGAPDAEPAWSART